MLWANAQAANPARKGAWMVRLRPPPSILIGAGFVTTAIVLKARRHSLVAANEAEVAHVRPKSETVT